jgi:DNA-binding FadR family transcriptional regulator
MSHLRLAERAYAGIVELIDVKGLQVGDRLPSESALAQMLSVSRSVIREALARLSSDGITEARRGAGSFVKSRPSDRLATYMPLAQMPTTMGSYEVRLVLETEAARLAALRRSPEAMTDIENALGRLRDALMSNASAHEEDLEFHRCIAEATANESFVGVLNSLEPDLDRIMRAGVDISRSRPPEVLQAMMREHEMIVEAIRAQDSEGAALAMRWHLWEGRKRLLP